MSRTNIIVLALIILFGFGLASAKDIYGDYVFINQTTHKQGIKFGDDTTQTTAAGSGTGDIIGPASATDNAIVRFNTTTGTLVQDSAVIVNDIGEIQGSIVSNYETYDMGFQSYMILTDPKLIFGWLNCPSLEIDISENKFVGTYNGTMTSADQLFKGKVFALDFDGVDDYVSVPDNAALTFSNGVTDEPFTFTGWIEVVDTAVNQTIFSKWDATTATAKQEYLMTLDAVEKLTLSFYDDTTSGQIGFIMQNTLAVGWHYVVVTYDASSTFAGFELYLDGVNATLVDISSGSYTTMRDLAVPVFVGAYVNASGVNDRFFQGDMALIILDKETVGVYDRHKLYLLGKAKGF